MITLFSKYDAENLIMNSEDEFRIMIHPGFVNKFSLYLTFRINKGVEIFSGHPKAMMAYWSISEYGNVIGLALENGYRAFIRKDGGYFKDGDWFLEFRKKKSEFDE